MAFTAIAKLIELYDGCKIPVKVGKLNLLLIQWNNRAYIIEDRCPHMDARLRDGAIADGLISCRAHGIAFSLDSGKAQGPLQDTLDCLKFFPPAYEGQWIGVEL